MSGKCFGAWILLTMASLPSWADENRLPLTTEARVAACLQAEDARPAQAIALADAVLDQTPDATPWQQAEALGCRGWARVGDGRRDAAFSDAHALFSLLQTLPMTAERVRLTRRAGGILHRGGDRVGAIDYYARAVVEAEQQGIEQERIALLANLGVLHSEFEEHERAVLNYEQALALMTRMGDFRHEAPVRFNLGLTYNGQRRFAEASEQLRRALALVEQSPQVPLQYLLSIRLALAKALVGIGEKEESARLIEQIRAADFAQLDPTMRMNFALIESDQRRQQGDFASALALIDGEDWSKGVNDNHRGEMLLTRVELLERLGRLEEAIEVLRESMRLRERHWLDLNHERLAALDSHLRNREQQMELTRLQTQAQAQAAQLKANQRVQWSGVAVLLLLLSVALAVLLWQRHINRLLLKASHTDPLTGLANRRRMGLHLSEVVSQGGPASALFLLDIDLFKRINDAHGHDVGDEVLITYAARLRTLVGQAGMVARWGGEEFLLVVHVADAEAAMRLADSVQQALTLPVETRVGPLQVTASIGIANLPLPGTVAGEDWRYSIQLADSALYLAKRAGRDAWVGYWVAQSIPSWPPERLGREALLARSLGILTAKSSRPLMEPAAAMI